ncbi:MAG: hypothetical protein Q4F84_11180, partial [Fibrobacter sp.]|nr:hypothetical protein [Fibrobacter sp.]
NVYEELDPTSPIIEQAKKGDCYELVFSGTSWYRVKVKDRQGWIEKKAGELTNSPKKSPVVSIIICLLLICAISGGTFFYLNKNKVASEE